MRVSSVTTRWGQQRADSPQLWRTRWRNSQVAERVKLTATTARSSVPKAVCAV